jgi:hypothetical protein
VTALTLVEEKLYHFRRIKYLLTKPEFSDIVVPLELIEKGDSGNIEKYLKNQVGLESFTIVELRDRAAILRVMPIFGLSKSQLIQRIREKQRELGKGEKGSQ